MDTSGDSARHHKPLPRCLTRLLEPAGIDAGYSAVPGARTENGALGYARVLAAVWLDLDRLAQLTPGSPPRSIEPGSR